MLSDDRKQQADLQASETILPASTADLDDSYQAYKSHEGEPIDPAEAKRVLRKIDMRIVPILFVVYLLQYLDKNSLNFSTAYGFKEGTHLHKQQYSWLSMLLEAIHTVRHETNTIQIQSSTLVIHPTVSIGTPH